MPTFTNQASLSYNGQTTNSNIVSGELISSVSVSKTAISTSYGANDRITYAISIVNNSGAAQNNVTVSDNLGAYTFGSLTLTPLEYVPDTANYYLNGMLQAPLTVTETNPLTFSGINLPAGSNAVIVYEVQTNSFAPLDSGSSITNTASVLGLGAPTDTATVFVREEPVLTISKSISDTVILENGKLTYTFIIQNSGNTAIVATDNLVITDTFNPILNNITVTLNGTALSATDYTYNTATGEFATADGVVTVPAAAYTVNPQTGEISATPGVAVLTVTGTL